MPAVADAGYTLIAPDLRGFGDSDKPLDGYDALNVAEDVHQLVSRLGYERVGVVGQDVGASVAYTFAAATRIMFRCAWEIEILDLVVYARNVNRAASPSSLTTLCA
jgi:pimeloyl-ACP methyl ester carboxylesterase